MATKRRLSGGGGATSGGGGTLPSPLSHSLAYLRRNQKGNREKRDGDQIYQKGANADEPVSPSHGWKNLWIQIRGRGSSGAASSLPCGGGRR
uniref:Uncharacterized protein LOC117313895 isoform X6 n=1 Tax=Tursiops truncatus TaxID=9739 RepID=A0A6J3S0U5_TURTR|nr:uncharacterized protein LOC117313895 isoform X6 [Tursiops truncatus]